ncbi:hypothetical protein SynBIOSE41_00916 [Synechococcus sp. BIOS-E4-1]|uniref:Nif11-like leader peptide family RiPP precursor n=1 Tax=Synechococcus sp. BIOS-E4-1 TaxID=1400864 RepID=UPI0016493799|nr:Nif11-like leader peptide family RiPP precursor [Synechococcus sp. BIOS-E4-1]QNI53443.1 hypothetical protein SynBIOSE41_00916 [Synechococcus sp. BIOS-E4-1]
MPAINDLIASLQNDTKLQQALMNATDPSVAEKIANDAGFQVSAQEILDAYQANLSELTEEELQACTGGKLNLNTPVAPHSTPTQPTSPVQEPPFIPE